MSICVKLAKSITTINKAPKINTPLLLSLQIGAFALFPLHAQVLAQDVTISDDTTTNLLTSTVNGGGPANIIITEDGKVTVTSGTAITVNSNHNISNDGLIDNTAISNGIGVHFDTQLGVNLISDFNLTKSVTISAPDDNQNLGTNNFGVLIDGDGTFQGSFLGSAASGMTIFGDNSAGLSLQTDMIGDINIGNLTILGDNSTALEVLGGLTGDINLESALFATGKDSYGIYIGDTVTGSISSLGNILTGTDERFDRDFNIVPAVAGIASVRISADVSGGFANNIQFKDSDDNIVNVASGDPTDGLLQNTSSIDAFAGGYALLVTPEKVNNNTWTDITIGNTNSFYGDYSIMNQGRIRSLGISDGNDAKAVYITGATKNNIIYSTVLDEGFYNGNWGTIEATTLNGDATAVHIGNYVTIPEIVNEGFIRASTTITTDDDGIINGTGGSAYGIIIDKDSTVLSFENSGSINIGAAGPTSSAIGIIDHSGTISDFSNTLTISTLIDDDSTGKLVAVDLSKNTSGINFFNSGNITGDIHLGNGTNVINLEGLSLTEVADLTDGFIEDGLSEDFYTELLKREITGAITLEGGSATLNMIGNARLENGIYSPNGQLVVSIKDQTHLGVDTSLGLNVTSLLVEDQAEISINVNGQEDFVGGIVSSGDVSFLDDSKVVIEVRGVIEDEGNFVIIEADTLTIDPDKNIQNTSANPFIYDVKTELTGNSLSLHLRRKGRVELGLTDNVGEIYEASISALLEDEDVAVFINNLKDIEEFNRIYREMMPNSFTQAMRQVILNSNNMSVGAVSGQLDNLRQLIELSKPQRARTGLWVQELGGFYNHNDGESEKGGSVFDFGLAMGYDAISTDRGAFGISFAYNLADLKLNGSGENRVA
ncbi:MAG: hypothetical protein HOM01_09615, partial [Kordiimonadaceae bacterium]|nr:hypothetical protein [Kordiimonadaceae bacterium]